MSVGLTEEQISLYGRQILVKAVGGHGQEALCAASVRVTGSSIARTYLDAGGTPEGDGGQLAVGAEGFAWNLGGCAKCHALTAQQLTATEDVEQGALAALMVQRAVLGLVAKQASHGVPFIACPEDAA
jgi:hypothetical protein